MQMQASWHARGPSTDHEVAMRTALQLLALLARYDLTTYHRTWRPGAASSASGHSLSSFISVLMSTPSARAAWALTPPFCATAQRAYRR